MNLQQLFWGQFVVWAMALSACSADSGNTALGTIERDRVVLKATASEIILEQPLKEGASVREGTLLVRLDDRRAQASVAAAKAEVARAEAAWAALRSGARIEDIDAAKARVEGAQAALTIADKSFTRTRELRDKQLASQATLDQAIAHRDSAEAELKSAQQHLLQLTNGTRKEELDQAEARYNAAQAQLALEQLRLSELSIRATRDGFLDSLPWNPGERVSAGAAVAVLLAGETAYARVYVPEPWRARLTPGDVLHVRVDGVDGVIQGRLRWIASEPAFTPYFALNERDRARLMYLAEVDLLDHRSLPLGLPAEVVFGE